jgi:hypothetical protein
MFRTILEILTLLAITFAWVTGQLDPLQKKLQEILLDMMGETKISYGLKSMVSLYPIPFVGVLLTIRRKSDRKEAS